MVAMVAAESDAISPNAVPLIRNVATLCRSAATTLSGRDAADLGVTSRSAATSQHVATDEDHAASQDAADASPKAMSVHAEYDTTAAADYLFRPNFR